MHGEAFSGWSSKARGWDPAGPGLAQEAGLAGGRRQEEAIMSEEVTIAVDAMGGDDAPGVVLDGVAQALEADGALHVVL